jgi:hypothetical protein
MGEAPNTGSKLQDLFHLPVFLEALLEGRDRPLLHGLASTSRELCDLVGALTGAQSARACMPTSERLNCMEGCCDVHAACEMQQCCTLSFWYHGPKWHRVVVCLYLPLWQACYSVQPGCQVDYHAAR